MPDTKNPKKKVPPFFKKMLTLSPEEFLATLMATSPNELNAHLTDNDVPSNIRYQLLHRIAVEYPELGQGLGASLLALASNDDSELKQANEKVQQLLDAMQGGPLRTGRFVSLLKQTNAAVRAKVIMQDGTIAYSVIANEDHEQELKRGDTVLLDAQAHAILYRDDSPPEIGEEATYDQLINEAQVRVTLDREEHRVLHASQDLIDKIKAGEIEAGTSLLVNTQQGFAFTPLPQDDELSHYKYMDRSPVPAEVSMGNVPGYIDRFCRHLEMVMHDPKVIKKWKQSMSQFVLLEGVTGTGKTMSLYVLWRRMAKLIGKAMGVNLNDVPLRVFRLKPSEIFEKWLGSSDRNLARFFKEVEQYASQPLTLKDGTVLPFTPCLAYIEELDGVAKSRANSDPLYSRILVTMLQYLDQTRPEMQNKAIFWAASTNVIAQVDSAVVRRCGGTIESFRHLDRSGFQSVVNTHLQDLKLTPNGTTDAAELRQHAVRELANWIYTHNDDQGMAEVLYANSEPETKYRRHFMTGALIARAVQEATATACEREYAGDSEASLTVQRLMTAFDQQIGAMADQLKKENAATMIELKEGAHVTDVRRLRPASVQPYQLRVAS